MYIEPTGNLYNMNSLFKHFSKISSLLALLILCGLQAGAQTTEEVLSSGTIREQFDIVQQRTRIYEGFRAVREDQFQALRRHSMDSLNNARQETLRYINELKAAQDNNKAIQALLDKTIEERDRAIGEKDNVYLAGMPMSKSFYNMLMWSIVAALIGITAIMFVLFNRSNRITRQTTRELSELQGEFDEYRKNSRERFEKQSIEHFNELRKLKGI
jgi:hypothetical protein